MDVRAPIAGWVVPMYVEKSQIELRSEEVIFEFDTSTIDTMVEASELAALISSQNYATIVAIYGEELIETPWSEMYQTFISRKSSIARDMGELERIRKLEYDVGKVDYPAWRLAEYLSKRASSNHLLSTLEQEVFMAEKKKLAEWTSSIVSYCSKTLKEAKQYRDFLKVSVPPGSYKIFKTKAGYCEKGEILASRVGKETITPKSIVECPFDAFLKTGVGSFATTLKKNELAIELYDEGAQLKIDGLELVEKQILTSIDDVSGRYAEVQKLMLQQQLAISGDYYIFQQDMLNIQKELFKVGAIDMSEVILASAAASDAALDLDKTLLAIRSLELCIENSIPVLEGILKATRALKKAAIKRRDCHKLYAPTSGQLVILAAPNTFIPAGAPVFGVL
ncbi:hypothetical protein AB7M31_002261 [Pseudomonas sp. IAP-CY TE4608]